MRVTASRDADAAYVADEDGTVVAYSADLNTSLAGNTTVSLSLGDHRPMTLRAFAHYPECTTASATPAASWDTQLAEFSYEESGGVMNKTGLSEADLNASEPRLVMADASAGRVQMLRQPRLFVPLVYVRCDSDRIVALRTFTRAEWPSQTATFDLPFTLPGGCLSARACATIPVDASAGCGGHPERCTEIDLLPRITAALERASPPRRLPTAASATFSSRSHERLEVHAATAECVQPPTAYVKDEAGRVVAYGHGALHVQVAPHHTASRHRAPRLGAPRSLAAFILDCVALAPPAPLAALACPT